MIKEKLGVSPDEYKVRRDALHTPQIEYVIQALHDLGPGMQPVKDICDATNRLLKKRYGKRLNWAFESKYMGRILTKLEFLRADFRKNNRLYFWIEDDRVKELAEFYGVELGGVTA